jgi:hypothetical protein
VLGGVGELNSVFVVDVEGVDLFVGMVVDAGVGVALADGEGVNSLEGMVIRSTALSVEGVDSFVVMAVDAIAACPQKWGVLHCCCSTSEVVNSRS